MKKLLYAVGVCLLAVACKPTPNQLTLKASGLSTTNDIYVFDLEENKAIDTIKVNDGGFTYTLDIEGEPKLMALTDQSSIMIHMIAEKGNLTLTSDTSSIVGSPQNDRFSELLKSYRNAALDFENKKQAILNSAQDSGTELSLEQVTELQNLNKQQIDATNLVVKSFYEKDKGTILGVFELMLMMQFLPEEEFMALYEQGGDAAKTFKPFVDMMEAKASKDKTKVGAKYLDFEGVNPKNIEEKIKLSDFTGKGRYILLDFWASWCQPCLASMPELKKLNDKYESKGLDIIGVVINDKIDDHLNAAKRMNVTWTQIFDDKNTVGQLYGLEAIPTLVLIDKDGTILVRSNDKQAIVDKLESLLGK